MQNVALQGVTIDLQRAKDRRCMCGMPIRQTTSTPISEGEECEVLQSWEIVPILHYDDPMKFL